MNWGIGASLNLQSACTSNFKGTMQIGVRYRVSLSWIAKSFIRPDCSHFAAAAMLQIRAIDCLWEEEETLDVREADPNLALIAHTSGEYS